MRCKLIFDIEANQARVQLYPEGEAERKILELFEERDNPEISINYSQGSGFNYTRAVSSVEFIVKPKPPPPPLPEIDLEPKPKRARKRK